ncbi:Sensor protein KdpD [Paraconexibacter sp. AEG42_29]|uniref:histidine kinase n=1 Tax=Paraconexibacter sp. AEG42_29 TaxID=2997339 RepID=A0AAU7AQB4_9ACTN
MESVPPLLLPGHRPPMRAGAAVAALGVGGCTAAVAGLDELTPAASLAVLYILPVLLVATYWGLRLALATALASALAFNVCFLEPTGRLTVADDRNLAALLTFVVVAIATSRVADLARARAGEAEARRQEADLAAELARGMLAGGDPDELLRTAAHRVAAALGVPSAALERGAVDTAGDPRREAYPLRAGDRTVATLLLPAALDPALRDRLLAHVLPALEALLAAALERDALQAEVVETQALRRSDVVKTAILRAVSHDLRSPLTSIITAGTALGSAALDAEDREALAGGVVVEAERLARVVDNLLDLSRLEAGTAAPRPDWCALDEVLHAAAEGLPEPAPDVRFVIDAQLPLLRADAAQLERAFTNLIANAVRHAPGEVVSVRARAVGTRLVVRVVDQGPGITPADQERVFEPFWRGPHDGSGAPAGSGLGLAIVRGFVEANGGEVGVESLPGQGSSFVVSFPLAEQPVQAVPQASP